MQSFARRSASLGAVAAMRAAAGVRSAARLSAATTMTVALSRAMSGKTCAAAPTNPQALIHPRDQIVETLARIYKYKMTTTSGGNLSVLDPSNGDVWITPAGVDKGSLRAKDICCVHADHKWEGPHRPSSEYPFHRAIYNTRPEFKAIVHAHPTSLVAFSTVRKLPVTALLHPCARLCGVPVEAAYDVPGSQELASHIANAFAHASRPRCVMLLNHGVVVGADNISTAFEGFETLEMTATTHVRAATLGEVRALTPEQLALVPEPCSRGKACCNGVTIDEQSPASCRERELRAQLVNFIRRGYAQRLFFSTEGSFSARIDDKSFVISANGVDRANITVQDFVVVNHEQGKVTGLSRTNGHVPSRAARMHAHMYAKHAATGAIVNAYPINATAFSVTATEFDTRTIPEAYLFLRDVKKVPFGVQFKNGGAEMPNFINPYEPIGLLENDGVMVTGKDVLHAFDRLEVLEATADALVKGKNLGEFVAISDKDTQKLNDNFKEFLEKMATP